MYHYVYQIISLSPNEEGVCRIYSGLRSCECLPEEDDYMGSGHAILNAINKYGREKFMKLIIAKFDTREAAHECETAWLSKQFNFHGRDWKKFNKFHYNLRLNENSRDGFYSSPETREKQRAAMIGKMDGAKNPNFGKTGENHPFFGKQHCEETKKKMSESKIGAQHNLFKGLSIGTNKDNQTIVFCGNKDMEARGFNQGAISQVINGARPHHKGFAFARTDDPDQLQELLNTAEFVDDVSKQRIEEFLSQ